MMPTYRYIATLPIFLFVLMAGWSGASTPVFAADIREDHPRLFFNADTLPAVVQRALNEENDWYKQIKGRVDKLLPFEKSLPSKGVRKDAVGENHDYGKEAAWSAFVYLVGKDTNYLTLARACIEKSLDYYEECYDKREEVHWDSSTRTHATMAIDWLYNDLPEVDRQEYLTRLIHVVNNVKNAKPVISREHMSSYKQGMYGMISLMWPIGVVAHGTGIESELVEDWIALGRQENMRMIEYRRRYVGDDGGGASPTLGYVACWYPYADWNFYYTLRSATGEDISSRLQHYTLLPNYLLWNLLPSSTFLREYGYGDATHVRGNENWSRQYLYTHMSIIEDLFGEEYPDTKAAAEQIKQQLCAGNRVWKDDYFIYPFLLTAEPEDSDAPARLDVGRIPMARNFEKTGQVIMRSGSGPEDVYCLFACGGELKQHRQYDALSFIIYSDDGFLAIDSGDRSGCGGNYEHLLNYYSQSIAHNTLLVHQPDEPLTTYWGRKPSIMDGGQHDVAASRLEAFETNDAYTYVAGDATGCYFHGGDLPEKVSWVTRQMVFLPPNIFVIFDRVNSTRPEYPKTWLLHTVNRPQRSGDTVYADHGKSRLFCRTLLPENAEISTIGGPGKEFWSAGRNWPLPVTQETEDEMKKYETAGRWRVEVQPAEQRLNDYFLHVLQVTGQNVEEMTEAKLLQTDQYYGVDLDIDGDRWKIQFNRTGSSGGKIACEGNTNLSQGLAQTVQPQSGIFTKGESSKAGWMERLLRIFRRN